MRAFNALSTPPNGGGDATGPNRLVYFHAEGDLMVAVIKVSADKRDNWLLSLRRGNERALRAGIAAGKIRKW